MYPPLSRTFEALDLVPFEDVKVVIIGQDPYHGPRQAHGLAFSVESGDIPPSLKNIFKEIENDLSVEMSYKTGNLTPWAKQGVLLLNNCLTVERGKAGSHRGKGWEQFTDLIVEELSSRRENLAFLLWGRDAQSKGKTLSRDKHLVLESVHPSPLSAHRGFFGCKHFSKVNKYLEANGETAITWTL